MKKSNVFAFLMALLFSVGMNAQSIVLTTPDMTVNQGEDFDVEVKVENFDEIISLQFAVFWDPSIIEFKAVDDYSLPEVDVDANEQNYQMYGHLGKLRFFWFDPDPSFSGVSLDDGSAIFKIKFKAIGGNSATSTVEVTFDSEAPPLPLEFVNKDGQEVDLDINVGTVTIEGPNSTSETVTQDFTFYQNHPNPFTDLTNISFYLNKTNTIELSIIDHSGKIIHKRGGDYSGGLHTIQLKRDLFASAGSYFITLKTENATATRQIIVQ